MKRFIHRNKWVIDFISNIVGYSVLAFLTGLVVKMPNTLFGGILAFDLVFLFIVFGGDDETLRIVKEFVTRKNIPPSVGAPDGKGAKY